MRILIATATKPLDFPKFCADLRAGIAEGGLTIPPGIYWVPGPGCNNLAFDLIGPKVEAEKIANVLTMALMPAKWSTTSDELPEVDTFVEA